MHLRYVRICRVTWLQIVIRSRDSPPSHLTSLVYLFAVVPSHRRVQISEGFSLGTSSPPTMHVITMQYNPLDCTCWAFGPFDYCEYCNLVCDATLEDFECELGDWFFLGQDGEFPCLVCAALLTALSAAGDRDADPAELQAFFEEGQAPTPGPSAPRDNTQVSRIQGETLRRPPRSACCLRRGAWSLAATLN
jgi:hypothetical protein